MNGQANLSVKVEIEKVKATPREGMTLDELMEKMVQIGNRVVGVNRKENYLLLEHK